MTAICSPVWRDQASILVAPLITVGMGGMQAESIALEGVIRGVAALADLETVAALKQSLP
jgi:hypothetical protein